MQLLHSKILFEGLINYKIHLMVEVKHLLVDAAIHAILTINSLNFLSIIYVSHMNLLSNEP